MEERELNKLQEYLDGLNTGFNKYISTKKLTAVTTVTIKDNTLIGKTRSVSITTTILSVPQGTVMTSLVTTLTDSLAMWKDLDKMPILFKELRTNYTADFINFVANGI